jgi:hypothetical protein
MVDEEDEALKVKMDFELCLVVDGETKLTVERPSFFYTQVHEQRLAQGPKHRYHLSNNISATKCIHVDRIGTRCRPE